MNASVYTVTFCFGVFFLRSQTVTPTVISNNGGFSSTAQGSIAWTIGEPVSETYSTSTNKTTMGFHQPELGIASLLKEQSNPLSVIVYPNPVSEVLKINLSEMPKKLYQLKLTDINGKTILEKEVNILLTGQDHELNLNNYAEGIYFLQISNDELNTTIKLNKIN